MNETLNVIGAFILGGILPFGTIGGLVGYYWARADIRRAVFKILHEHWPVDYAAAAMLTPYDCARCSTPCNDEMSYCPGCGRELEPYSAE